MYRRLIAVTGWPGILIGALALATLACGEQSAQIEKLSTDSTKSSRIVSLSAELSQLLVEFELAAQIVGVDAESHSLPELASAANLGEFEGLDVSAVAAVKPDFVLALGEESQISFAAGLSERGIPLYVFNPTTANAVIQTIQDLGIILDRKDRARSTIRRLTQETSRIATERDGEKRPSVAWILQREPLVVVGNSGLLHEILELAGGEMAIHRIPGERIEVSFDLLAASHPDLILDSTPQSKSKPIAMGVRTEVLPTWIGELPTLDMLGRIRVIHGLLYPSQ